MYGKVPGGMSSNSEKVQTVEFNFDAGMDQRQHPKQLQGPAVLTAANVRWKNSGGMTKRFGLTNIASGFRGGYALVPGQCKIMGFREELLVTDSYRIGSLSRANGTNWFVDKGKVPECVSRMRPIDSTQYNISGPDVAYSSGLTFHAYLGGYIDVISGTGTSSIYSTVEDTVTGALIISSLPVAVGRFYTPHLIAIGGTCVMVYRDNVLASGPALPNIYYRVWDMASMAWGSQVTLYTTAVADIAVCTDGTFMYLLHSEAATLTLRLKKYSISGATLTLIASITPTEASQAGYGLGICATVGELVWITYNVVGATSLVRAAAYPTSLASETTAPFTINTVATTAIYTSSPVRLSSTTALVSMGNANDARFPVISSSGGFVGSQTSTNRTTYWCLPGSKPFVASTTPLRCYVWAYVGGANIISANDLNNQYTFMLLDLLADSTSPGWSPRPITWQAPRYSIVDNMLSLIALWGPPSVAQISATRWDTDFSTRKNARTRNGINAASADFGTIDKYANCELGQTLFVSPGFYWDKDRLAEVGFAYWPQGITVTVTATGGTYGTTVRSFVAMYEYVDANGFIHRSIPSPPVGVAPVSGTTNSFNIEVPCLTVTARQNPVLNTDPNSVRIVIYALNTVTGLYERIFPEGREGLNDPKLKSITLTDTGGNLSAIPPPREILYTETGVYPNVMPNSWTACVTYRNRVWIAYNHTVMYSKAFVTGETVNFTDAFELPLEESGDITAMWKMDDTLYIATKTCIYYIQADGPNDFGQQNDISTPNRVATDRGVIDQRSIAVTPIGTLYQSSVGIQLMDRSRTVAQEPVGARVQDDLAAFPEVVSANVHPNGRYVTFSCRNPITGIRLVFDYALNRWSRDTIYSDNISIGSIVYSETVVGSTTYTAVIQFNSTNIGYEDPTLFTDFTSWVFMGVEFAEIHPGGMQTKMGIRNWQILNDRHTDHDILLQFRRDYESSVTDTVLFNSDVISSIAPREQLAVNPSTHQVQSARLTMTDAFPSGAGHVLGTGRGATFLGITVDVEPIQKVFRTPDTNQR